MGNCVRKDSDKQWGGDYWGSPIASPEHALLSGQPCQVVQKNDQDSYKRPSTETKIKIKITKKQLEKILDMKEMQGLTLQQVLDHLINGRDDGFESNQRSWRPALQSIAE
uniref:uncharacterized protein LOC122610728 n=1 Tax=Erigeron canadensis TaxID=72917 RepID=UPI001CB96007|nr:uncharacterized protein LOC122610728 [Erigeron canadensis]